MPPLTRSQRVLLDNLQQEDQVKEVATDRTERVLLERLSKWETIDQLPPTPESLAETQSECESDNIHPYTSQAISNKEETKSSSTSSPAAKSQIKHEAYHVGHRVVFPLGGLEGRIIELRNKNTSRESKITLLEDKVDELIRKGQVNKWNIESLECHVATLTATLESYKLVRNRFISTFKYTKLNNATDEDMKIIAEGDICPDGGDVIGDAELYKSSDGRQDWYDFEQLYGFPPPVIQSFTHPEIIEVLNIHGTVIASSNKHGSDKFYQRFANFVDLFKKSEYNEDFLEGPPTAVTAAYWAFLRSSKEEVSEKTDG